MKLKLNKGQKEIAWKIIEPFVNTFLKCMNKYTCTELKVKGKVFIITRIR